MPTLSRRPVRLAILAPLALAIAGCAGMTSASANPAPDAPLVAGQFPQAPVEEGGYEWQLHVPRALAAQDPEDRKLWPLMIFLHGSGERGSDVARVKVHGPPKVADADPDFPFILISPLLPSDEDWNIEKLRAILDRALQSHPVDPDRIYLTGLSRGGHATWRWAAQEPGLFAAIAPVAGRGDEATACNLTEIPVWAFHGDRDDVVVPEGSFAMSRAIRACGGRRSRLTIYPDLGHNSWDPAYADPALYLWLLKHRKMSEIGEK
ncbi:hypothetical protein [Qipengyuania sp. JC766]|uniref:carboxylesterase family protein n=1 Tax=Qipengyuania sp. JC766 TaxID=3232139 RepID=UPI00345850F9